MTPIKAIVITGMHRGKSRLPQMIRQLRGATPRSESQPSRLDLVWWDEAGTIDPSAWNALKTKESEK